MPVARAEEAPEAVHPPCCRVARAAHQLEQAEAVVGAARRASAAAWADPEAEANRRHAVEAAVVQSQPAEAVAAANAGPRTSRAEAVVAVAVAVLLAVERLLTAKSRARAAAPLLRATARRRTDRG